MGDFAIRHLPESVAPVWVLHRAGCRSGVGSPLVVVDGTVVPPALRRCEHAQQAMTLASLDSTDIESVRVVSGPDAFKVYGESAANGVIEVATHRVPTRAPIPSLPSVRVLTGPTLRNVAEVWVLARDATELVIADAMGRLVWHAVVRPGIVEVPTQSLPPGTYEVRAGNGPDAARDRFVVV